MPPFAPSYFLLAEVTVQAVGGWIAALFVSGGVLWVLFLLVVQGFWDKTGKPAVKDLLVTVNAEPETVQKHTAEVERIIAAWHNDPEQVRTRTEFIKGIIDNEVRRDDGLIHRDTRSRVSALEAELARKIDSVAAKFDKFQEVQERRDQDNRAFNAQVLAKLACIEGAFATLEGRHFGQSAGSMLASRNSTNLGDADSEG